MSVSLSSHDVERIARAVELLVSPLDHPSVDAWRAAVNRELMDLLGADSAGFLLAVHDGPFIHSEEHDPAELARYPGFLPPPLADGTPFWDSVLDMEVGGLVEMYRGDDVIYRESAYYREYAGANGAHDPLALVVSLDGSRDVLSSASVQFWHDSTRGRRFGEREKAILRILLPAFRAGVETQRRFEGRHARLTGMIDALGQAVYVWDAHGRALHRTQALSGMLAADPDSATILAAIEDAVRAARVALIPGAAQAVLSGLPAMTSDVVTPTAAYRIVVSLHRNAAVAYDTMLFATVERTTPLPMSEERMRALFGLTKAEARVATLIGGGLSNAEIAARLCISPHTARRHTERVLMKLNVRSRAEVPPKILR